MVVCLLIPWIVTVKSTVDNIHTVTIVLPTPYLCIVRSKIAAAVATASNLESATVVVY